MNGKQVSAECNECESSFDVAYMDKMVSQDLPQYCPFCGEPIDDVDEHYISDEDDNDLDREWD
jgi:NAD-dependent SIR2 family protein deacetylase